MVPYSASSQNNCSVKSLEDQRYVTHFGLEFIRKKVVPEIIMPQV